MSPVWGAADEPRNQAELIADTMLAAADSMANRIGVNVKKAFIAVVIEGQAEGEPDGVAAGAGYDDSEGLLMDLSLHAQKLAEQLGISFQIHRLGGDG